MTYNGSNMKPQLITAVQEINKQILDSISP